jgi:hypothetical protein
MEATLHSYTECPAKYNYARWVKGQCFALSLPEDGINVVVEDEIECIRLEVIGDSHKVEQLNKLMKDRMTCLRKEAKKWHG